MNLETYQSLDTKSRIAFLKSLDGIPNSAAHVEALDEVLMTGMLKRNVSDKVDSWLWPTSLKIKTQWAGGTDDSEAVVEDTPEPEVAPTTGKGHQRFLMVIKGLPLLGFGPNDILLIAYFRDKANMYHFGQFYDTSLQCKDTTGLGPKAYAAGVKKLVDIGLLKVSKRCADTKTYVPIDNLPEDSPLRFGKNYYEFDSGVYRQLRERAALAIKELKDDAS